MLGIVTDPAGVRRLHFLAHDINYNAAQSGSDWANHYVLIGTAILDGETLGEITLKTAVDSTIREADWSRYETGPVLEEVRDRVLGELGVSPPKPEMETIRIVRCPHCGSTDAGEIEALYEITRMSCHACGHTELCDSEEIKDEWNVSHERRKDRPRLPGFVPPLATSEPGFELRGASGDETKLLVHPGIGYAIAVAGGPWMSGSAGGQSAVLSIPPYIHIIVRAERRYSDLAAGELLRRELAEAACLRAIENSVLELEQAPVPLGATTSMFVTYPRRVVDDDGDVEDITELLAVTIHDDKPEYFKLVFLYVDHTAGRLDPYTWTNLRAALLAHQTWQSGQLPSLNVCPPTSAFADTTVSLRSTMAASRDAEGKAEVLGAMTAEQAKRVIDRLVAAAGTLDPPTTPWRPADTDRISRMLSEIVGPDLAQVLTRDLDQVQSMHDFRAWCRCCERAVESRGRKRR